MLFSKLHCQKAFELKLLPYRMRGARSGTSAVKAGPGWGTSACRTARLSPAAIFMSISARETHQIEPERHSGARETETQQVEPERHTGARETMRRAEPATDAPSTHPPPPSSCPALPRLDTLRRVEPAHTSHRSGCALRPPYPSLLPSFHASLHPSIIPPILVWLPVPRQAIRVRPTISSL